MAPLHLVLGILLLCVQSCLASEEEDRRTNHGLVGYGIDMFDPPCAYACRSVVSKSALECTPPDAVMSHHGHSQVNTPPECFATDDAFLQTMALCLSTRCSDESSWRLEFYWSQDLVGRSDDQPLPKESFGETLARISSPPNVTMAKGEPLDETSLVPEEDWLSYMVTLKEFARTEAWHSRSGLIVVLTIFLAPIALFFLQYAPIPKRLISKANAFLVYPALFGKRHSQPMPLNIGIVPTRGQSLFIIFIIVINVIFSGVGITVGHPNAFFQDDISGGVKGLVANRLGVLSFANLVLVFLYAGRNNILLWLTDWSHSTFLLLHRWIAYVAILMALMHSILYLDQYLESGMHATESVKPYWYCGIIATLSFTLILPLSILPVRQRLYEFFLAFHIIFAALAVIGCYLHIWFRFQHMWGYETWLYPVMAIWAFDRLVRVLRLMRNGVRTAEVSVIDHDYTMVSVPGVAADGYAYLYFPTLTWRIWENHPFSVASVLMPSLAQEELKDGSSLGTESRGSTSGNEKLPISSATEYQDPEANAIDSRGNSKPTLGLTFFIRNRSGLTSLLQSRRALSVLVESPYGRHASVESFPTFICVAGGVGITSVLPALRKHVGYTKLYWGVRSAGIVKAMEPYLVGVDKVVSVGKRLAIADLLRAEIDTDCSDVAVMVSGPPQMTDDVRAVVGELGKRAHGRRIKFVEESFTW